MENCIFCKIIKKEIPSSVIYENNDFLAFLDINPVSHGHTLLITKNHYEWIQDTPDEIISKIFVLAKELIKKMKENLPCDYVQLSVVGKDVPHLHIHLIPRYFNDSLRGWETFKYKDGEIDQAIKSIFK